MPPLVTHSFMSFLALTQLEELKQQQKLDRQKEQERKRKLEVSPDDEQSNVETQEVRWASWE